MPYGTNRNYLRRYKFWLAAAGCQPPAARSQLRVARLKFYIILKPYRGL
jgi:hypothetical protein